VSSLAQGGQLPALAGGRPPEQRLDKDSIDERDELQAVVPPGRTLSSTLCDDGPALLRQQRERLRAEGALGGVCAGVKHARAGPPPGLDPDVPGA